MAVALFHIFPNACLQKNRRLKGAAIQITNHHIRLVNADHMIVTVAVVILRTNLERVFLPLWLLFYVALFKFLFNLLLLYFSAYRST